MSGGKEICRHSFLHNMNWFPIYIELVGFYYNVTGKEYLYQRNILGDIVGILNDEEELMGEYFSDAYGNHRLV